jgi:hypothetical protein
MTGNNVTKLKEMAMIGNFHNLTSFNHKFVEGGIVATESGITTRSDTWTEITYEFINFLKSCGYHPDRKGLEDVLDAYFGCSECDGCDEPDF